MADYTSTSGLSNWAGPTVADMIGRSTALAQSTAANPPVYGAAMTAAPNALQQQAWGGLAGLTVPDVVGTAGNTLNQIAGSAQGMNYTPGTITNQYQAPGVYTPGTIANTFQAPGAYTPTTIQSTFQAPGAYQAANVGSSYNAPAQALNYTSTVGNLNTTLNAPSTYTAGTYSPDKAGWDKFTAQAMQEYMSPFIQGALDPQLRAAQEAATQQRMQNAARMAKAGAFGGSRQAIMEAQGAQDLQTLMSDITGKGYQSAFENAQQQFERDQQRRQSTEQFNINQALEAARLGEQSRQFGANYGLDFAKTGAQQQLEAAKLREMANQFGVTSALQAAGDQARYASMAQQLNEQSRQFGAGQAMTAAQLQAQYGLDAAKAQEMANQFASQQAQRSAEFAATMGLQTQTAQETANQFAARYGLDALNAAANAASTAGRFGLDQYQGQLSGLQALQTAGQQQAAMEQAGLTADYQEWLRQQQQPFDMLRFEREMLQGLPLTETTSVSGGDSGGVTGLLSSLSDLLSLGRTVNTALAPAPAPASAPTIV